MFVQMIFFMNKIMVERMKNLLTIMLITVLTYNLSAQNTEKSFEPNGSPFAKIFVNYHSLSVGKEKNTAFQLQRAYFGYSYNLSETFSSKVNLDVGNPENGSKLEMTAYLKNAYVQYEEYGITTKFGLIPTSQFELSEKIWAGRYLYKSFQDQHDMGYSADLGMYLSYKIHKIISVDASILNGEGYKKLAADNIMKYAAGVTLKPLEGVTLRTYYDELGNSVIQRTIAFFGAYQYENLTFGAEYNQQLNHKNIKDSDLKGMSFFGSYKTSFARFFARFDQLSSKDNWNEMSKKNADGSAIIAGAEFFPVRGLKISPNYQGWTPKVKGADPTYGLYINFEIKY